MSKEDMSFEEGGKVFEVRSKDDMERYALGYRCGMDPNEIMFGLDDHSEPFVAGYLDGRKRMEKLKAIVANQVKEAEMKEDVELDAVAIEDDETLIIEDEKEEAKKDAYDTLNDVKDVIKRSDKIIIVYESHDGSYSGYRGNNINVSEAVFLLEKTKMDLFVKQKKAES